MKTKNCSLTGRADTLFFTQPLPFMEMVRQPYLPFMETASSNYVSGAK
jgi:hypothetical protein